MVMLTPTETLIEELIALGCPPARAFTLVNDAMRQWQQPARSRHAIAQAKYYAKKRSERLSHTDQHVISTDQCDQLNFGKEGPPHTPPKETITTTIPPTAGSSAMPITTQNDRKTLWNHGVKLYVSMTKCSESTARSLIGRWDKLVGGNPLQVLSAIEQASIEQPANPSAWIFGCLKKIAMENQIAAAPPNSTRQELIRERTKTLAAANIAYFSQISDGPENCGTLARVVDGTFSAVTRHEPRQNVGNDSNPFMLSRKHDQGNMPSRNGHGDQIYLFAEPEGLQGILRGHGSISNASGSPYSGSRADGAVPEPAATGNAPEGL